MSDLEVRSFDPDDLRVLASPDREIHYPSGWSIHGMTITMDGRPIAAGGLVLIGSHWWTFAEITALARKPFLVHRLVMRGLEAADRSGIRRIYGYCDDAYPRARAWIERMGFRPAVEADKDAEVRAVEDYVRAPAWVRG